MDRDAELSDLYREQYRPLVRYLYRMVGDVGRAEEVAQEAFVRALQHHPEHPRAWVYRVATNLARDLHRRRAVRRQHLQVVKAGVEPGSGTVRPSAAPDQVLERRERDSRVRSALEELAERDREALLMWEEGLSYDDIAESLGLSRGSIGTTLSRARRRLADAYRRLEAPAPSREATEGSSDATP